MLGKSLCYHLLIFGSGGLPQESYQQGLGTRRGIPTAQTDSRRREALVSQSTPTYTSLIASSNQITACTYSPKDTTI